MKQMFVKTAANSHHFLWLWIRWRKKSQPGLDLTNIERDLYWHHVKSGNKNLIMPVCFPLIWSRPALNCPEMWFVLNLIENKWWTNDEQMIFFFIKMKVIKYWWRVVKALFSSWVRFGAQCWNGVHSVHRSIGNIYEKLLPIEAERPNIHWSLLFWCEIIKLNWNNS